jgi:two-component system response regulator AtoC
MRMLHSVASDVAGGDTPVLIVGESGTGKQALALHIHRESRRRNQSFTVIDCAALSPDFFSSGANAMSAAALFSAGTVFLNEIGDLSSACQPKLLKVLSGNGGEPPAQARTIASTCKNLEQEIQHGRFREELYYRISGVCLRVPPLRHRREDIRAMCDYFLGKYAALLQRPEPALSGHMQRVLLEHSWPGNVRELEETIKMLVALGDERLAIAGLRARSMASQRGNGSKERVSLKEAARSASRLAERELILRVLSRTRWNRKRAAQELQISYKALLYKLKQIGFEDEFTAEEDNQS